MLSVECQGHRFTNKVKCLLQLDNLTFWAYMSVPFQLFKEIFIKFEMHTVGTDTCWKPVELV